MIPLARVLRALAPGGVQGDRGRDTGPILRLAEGLPCSLTAVPPGAEPGYVQRTMGRDAALRALEPLCFWHLHLVEVSPDIREVTALRRELHIRLRNSQLVDNLAYAKFINGGG